MISRKTGIDVGASLCQIERGIPMIRVLICDDDPLFLNKIHTTVLQSLDEMGVKAKIHAYGSWNEIGSAILSSCDIAFLDVDFERKQYTGLDIARKIRESRPDAIIIFVTNFIEYAPEGFEVQAFRYLMKKDVENKLEKYLNLALLKLNAIRKTMKIQVNGELIDIPLSNILYFESQQHTILIHAQKSNAKQIKTYRFYSSLTNVEKQLEGNGFLRIHKSYLVNMNQLKRFQCHEAVLTNGTVLRVSEKNYAEQKAKYLLWKGR